MSVQFRECAQCMSVQFRECAQCMSVQFRECAQCMSVQFPSLYENEEQVLNIMAVHISHNNTEAVRFCIPAFITFAAGRPLEARVTTLLSGREGWTVTKHRRRSLLFQCSCNWWRSWLLGLMVDTNWHLQTWPRRDTFRGCFVNVWQTVPYHLFLWSIRETRTFGATVHGLHKSLCFVSVCAPEAGHFTYWAH